MEQTGSAKQIHWATLIHANQSSNHDPISFFDLFDQFDQFDHSSRVILFDYFICCVIILMWCIQTDPEKNKEEQRRTKKSKEEEEKWNCYLHETAVLLWVARWTAGRQISMRRFTSMQVPSLHLH